MAIGSLFKSGSRELMQRIQARDFSSSPDKQELCERLASSKDVKVKDAMRLLFAPDAELRKAVGALLAARRDPETLQHFLLASSGRPDAARRAAISILQTLPLGNVPILVGKFLDDGEANMRRLAAETLFELPLTEQSAPLLTRIIERGEAAQRLKAVQRFAQMATADYVPYFTKLLSDPDPRIRQAAYQTIVRFATPADLDLLLRKVAEEPYAIQQMLIRSIQELLPHGGDEAIDKVLALLASGSPPLRSATFKILLSLPDRTPVVRKFIAYSRQLVGWVRDRALDSLREFGPEVLEPALELASDPDPVIRSSVLNLLSGFDDPRVGHAAISALEDEDWWIAISAADLLGRMQFEPAVPALCQCLRRDDVRWAAAEALGRIGGPQALQTLAELTQDSWPEVRIEALNALAMTGDDRVLPILQAAAQSDPKKWLRTRAYELLTKLAASKNATVELTAVREAVNATELDEDSPQMHRLLAHARREGASDLHISVDSPPLLRLGGELKRLDGEALSDEQSRELLLGLLDDDQKTRLAQDHQLDACFYVKNDGRYRGNLFVDRKGLNGVFRVIPAMPPTIYDLALPDAIADIALLHQGIVIVTGPSGSGKSTTLAAIVNLLNETRRAHILTIEDPVEFVHPFRNSLLNQRDVGKHTMSYANALRSALREDPDVIVIGELRDPETVTLALTAAETGHIVLTTLNANTSAKAVDRVVNSFPATEQPQVRESFAGCLKMILAQNLVPTVDGRSRVGCYELLKATTPIINLIRDNKTYQIPSLMQIGQQSGMRTFDESLLELVRAGKVAPETAYVRATSKEAFEPLVTPRFLEEILQ